MGMELKEQTMSFMFLYYKCLKAINLTEAL